MGYEFSNDRWIQNKKREIREGKCCVICNIRVVYKCKQCNTIEIIPLAVSDVSTLLLIVADYNVCRPLMASRGSITLDRLQITRINSVASS